MSTEVRDVPERDELSDRHRPPAHYEVEIKSVSKLLNLQEYKFGPFEAGGYYWRLKLQPQGHKTEVGKKYMSLYLVLDEPNKLGVGERILVDYKFFVLDNNKKKYVIFKERGKELGAFSRVNKERGLEKFLSLESFNKAENYFRDGESCTIGAELMVSKPTRKKETLTIIPSSQGIIPSSNESLVKIQPFSTSKSSSRYSEKFCLGGREWKLEVCRQQEKGKERLSVHLEAQSISAGKNIFVKAMLRVVNEEHQAEVSGWLNANNKTLRKPSFVPWSNLGQLKGGFIQKKELHFKVNILTKYEVRRTYEPVG